MTSWTMETLAAQLARVTAERDRLAELGRQVLTEHGELCDDADTCQCSAARLSRVLAGREERPKRSPSSSPSVAEQVLELARAGMTANEIAEVRGVSRQAVSLTLKKLAPILEAEGLHPWEKLRRRRWVPWQLGHTGWRFAYPIKMLRLLGRQADGLRLSEAEVHYLQRFLAELDDMPDLPGGRGVVSYDGPATGVRIVGREPGDRGYVRWPKGVPDTRPRPPAVVLPDDPPGPSS